MKLNVLFIFFILLIIFLTVGIISAKQLEIGGFAPDFKLTDNNGEIFTLSENKGKKVVLFFFPRVNPPGWIKQNCSFRDSYSWFIDNNINVIGISYDSSIRHNKFSKTYNLPYRLLSDNDKKVSKLYGANGFFFPKRITFLIDENGRIFDILDKAKLDLYAEETIKRFQAFQTSNSQKDLNAN